MLLQPPETGSGEQRLAPVLRTCTDSHSALQVLLKHTKREGSTTCAASWRKGERNVIILSKDTECLICVLQNGYDGISLDNLASYLGKRLEFHCRPQTLYAEGFLASPIEKDLN